MSAHIARTLYDLQRRAAREGRGKQALAAMKEIYERLQRAPMSTGEPLYNLEALRLYVRTTVIRPLAVDFAVSEERPVVYLKGVRLLSS